MPQHQYNFSIVIPAYNESTRIHLILDALIAAFSNNDHNIELVFINDGSSDNTTEILEKFAEENKKKFAFQILHNKKNSGKGNALRKGMVAATGDFILSTDADFSYPLEKIFDYIDELKKLEIDIAVGSRFHKDTVFENGVPLHRGFFGRVFVLLVWLIIGIKRADLNCGFKVFTQKSARDIFGRQLIDGWSYDAETFFIAQKHNYQIVELPVKLFNRGESRVRVVSAITNSLIELIKIRVNSLKNKY